MEIHTLMNTCYVFSLISGAFDTISHDILMKKLYFYGFRGKAHEWIHNYLTNRRQFVYYNKSHSQLGITAGVPQ